MNNTVIKKLSVPSFRWDIIESCFNQMAAQGYRFVSKNKANYYFEKDALPDGMQYVVYAYSSNEEAQSIKNSCKANSLIFVFEDVKAKLLIYSGADKMLPLPEQLSQMQEHLRNKRKTKTVFWQAIILAVYGLFLFYYCSGLGEYTYNLLEAHLHSSEMVFVLVSAILMGALTLLRLLLFAQIFLKKRILTLNHWYSVQKSLSIVTIVFLIVSQLGIGILQGLNSGETVEGIPDGLQYVKMEQFFPEGETNNKQIDARTYLGETDRVITESYTVSLFYEPYGIDTRCTKITNKKILSNYYAYEKNKNALSQSSVAQIPLNAGEKSLLNAEDGFIRNDTYANIVEVVFLKGDRVIRVELRGIKADMETMLTQIGLSFA